MKFLEQYFADIIERFSRYDNIDTAKVINDVIKSMTFRA